MPISLSRKYLATALVLYSIIWLNSISAETRIETGAGYRIDFFSWNIAGNLFGRSPNVVSELSWDLLEIFQLNARIVQFVEGKYYIRAAISGGEITHGINRDSDYYADNRNFEYARSYGDAGEGSVFEASLGIGYYPLHFLNAQIAPILGYAYNMQYLTIKNGFQAIPQTGPYPGLKSYYWAQWQGPWIGMDIKYKINDILQMSGVLEIHATEYSGLADWNMRHDLAHPNSMDQKANALGIMIDIAGEYNLSVNYTLGLTVGYHNMTTFPGVHRFIYANSSPFLTRLNTAQWNSTDVAVQLIYRR